jgi:iron-sulfur cluster repair protein YtfE (RIC family)
MNPSTNPSKTTANIITALKADHKELRSLCAQLNETSERAVKRREALFHQLFLTLSSHAKAEEEAMYAPIKEEEGKELRMKVLEGYEEHKIADTLMEELDFLDFGDEKWTAKMQVLSEALDHHIKEEEQEVFPMMKKELPEQELRAMGDDFLTRKREILEQLNSIQAGSGQPGISPGMRTIKPENTDLAQTG